MGTISNCNFRFARGRRIFLISFTWSRFLTKNFALSIVIGLVFSLIFIIFNTFVLKSKKHKLNISKLTFYSGDNAASQEFTTRNNIERCPLCGIALNENGVCPKCGYKK